MKYTELKKILVANGCEYVREGKGNKIWFSPKTKKTFLVGRHKSKEVPNGTLQSILKSVGFK